MHITKPDGTFYCLPDFRAYNKNSVELANFLLKKALVVTVPGYDFGMEGHLRLSYCGHRQGYHGRRQAHQVGAGPEGAQ